VGEKEGSSEARATRSPPLWGANRTLYFLLGAGHREWGEARQQREAPHLVSAG
jgi:hypothetical protein